MVLQLPSEHTYQSRRLRRQYLALEAQQGRNSLAYLTLLQRYTRPVYLPRPIIIPMSDTPSTSSSDNQPQGPTAMERLETFMQKVIRGDMDLAARPYQIPVQHESVRDINSSGHTPPRDISHMIPKERRAYYHQRRDMADMVGAESIVGDEHDLSRYYAQREVPAHVEQESQKQLVDIWHNTQALLDVSEGKHPLVAALQIPEFHEHLRQGNVSPQFLVQAMNAIDQKNINRHSQNEVSDRVVSERLTQVANQPTAEPQQSQSQETFDGSSQHLQSIRTRLERMAAIAQDRESNGGKTRYDLMLESWSQKLNVPVERLRDEVKGLSDEQIDIIQGRKQSSSDAEALQQLVLAAPGSGKSELIKAMTLQMASEGVNMRKVQYVSPTHSGKDVLGDILGDIRDILPAGFIEPRTVGSLAWRNLFTPNVLDSKTGSKVTAMQYLGMGDISSSILTDERDPTYDSLDDIHGKKEASQQRFLQLALQQQGIDTDDENSLNSLLTSISAQKKDRSEYNERMTAGEKLYNEGWIAQRQAHPNEFKNIPEDLGLYIHEATRRRDKGFGLNVPQFSQRMMDQDDLVLMLGHAARKGAVARPEKLYVDEAQDLSPVAAESLAAFAHKREVLMAGDPSQVVVQGRTGAETFLPNAFKDLKISYLTGNYRMNMTDTALINTIGQDPRLRGTGVSPQQVSMKGIGQAPAFTIADNLYQMNRERVRSIFEQIGMSIPQMINNIDEGRAAFEGAAMSPSQVPAISQTKRARQEFQRALTDMLREQGNMGKVRAEAVLKKVYSEKAPGKKDGDKLYNLTIPQARSRSFEKPHTDVARTGKWGEVGYLRNLYTMLSRAKDRNFVFGSRYTFEDEQGKFGAQHVPENLGGTLVPHGFTMLLKGSGSNMLAQGASEADLPELLRIALRSNVEQAINPSLVSREFPLQRFLQTVLGLNKHAAPDVNGAAALINASDTEQTSDFQEVQNMGSSGGTLNAAALTGQFGRSITRPVSDFSNYVGQLLTGGIGQSADILRGLLKSKEREKGFIPENVDQVVEAAKIFSAREKLSDYEKAELDMAAGANQPEGEDMRSGGKVVEPPRRDIYDTRYRAADDEKLMGVIKSFSGSSVARHVPLVQSLIASHFTDDKFTTKLLGNEKVSQEWKKRFLDFDRTSGAQAQALYDAQGKNRQAALRRGETAPDEMITNIKAFKEQFHQQGIQQLVSSLLNAKGNENLRAEMMQFGQHQLGSRDYMQMARPANLHLLANQLAGTDYLDLADYFRESGDKIYANQSGVTITPEYWEGLQHSDPMQAKMLEQWGFGPNVNVEQQLGGGPLSPEPLFHDINDPDPDRRNDFATSQMNFERSFQPGENGLNEFGMPLYMSEMAPIQGQFAILQNALEKSGIVDPHAIQDGQLEGASVSLSGYRKRLQDMLRYSPLKDYGINNDQTALEAQGLLEGESMSTQGMSEHDQNALQRDLEALRQRVPAAEMRKHIQGQLAITDQAMKLYNPENQLNWSHIANMVMRASTGDAIIHGEEYRPDNARSFFANVVNGYSDGSRSLENMAGLSSAFESASKYVQKTGKIRRRDVNSILESLGHPTDYASNPALQILADQHNFVAPSADIPISLLAGNSNKALSQMTRFPLLPNQFYKFMGGNTRTDNGYTPLLFGQKKEKGLQKGMIGLLSPFQFTDKQGKRKTVPFGRPVTKGVLEYHGLLEQEEAKHLKSLDPKALSEERAKPADSLFHFIADNKKYLVRGSQLAPHNTARWRARPTRSLQQEREHYMSVMHPEGISQMSDWMQGENEKDVPGVGRVPISYSEYQKWLQGIDQEYQAPEKQKELFPTHDWKTQARARYQYPSLEPTYSSVMDLSPEIRELENLKVLQKVGVNVDPLAMKLAQARVNFDGKPIQATQDKPLFPYADPEVYRWYQERGDLAKHTYVPGSTFEADQQRLERKYQAGLIAPNQGGVPALLPQQQPVSGEANVASVPNTATLASPYAAVMQAQQQQGGVSSPVLQALQHAVPNHEVHNYVSDANGSLLHSLPPEERNGPVLQNMYAQAQFYESAQDNGIVPYRGIIPYVHQGEAHFPPALSPTDAVGGQRLPRVVEGSGWSVPTAKEAMQAGITRSSLPSIGNVPFALPSGPTPLLLPAGIPSVSATTSLPSRASHQMQLALPVGSSPLQLSQQAATLKEDRDFRKWQEDLQVLSSQQHRNQMQGEANRRSVLPSGTMPIELGPTVSPAPSPVSAPPRVEFPPAYEHQSPYRIYDSDSMEDANNQLRRYDKKVGQELGNYDPSYFDTKGNPTRDWYRLPMGQRPTNLNDTLQYYEGEYQKHLSTVLDDKTSSNSSNKKQAALNAIMRYIPISDMRTIMHDITGEAVQPWHPVLLPYLENIQDRSLLNRALNVAPYPEGRTQPTVPDPHQAFEQLVSHPAFEPHRDLLRRKFLRSPEPNDIDSVDEHLKVLHNLNYYPQQLQAEHAQKYYDHNIQEPFEKYIQQTYDSHVRTHGSDDLIAKNAQPLGEHLYQPDFMDIYGKRAILRQLLTSQQQAQPSPPPSSQADSNYTVHHYVSDAEGLVLPPPLPPQQMNGLDLQTMPGVFHDTVAQTQFHEAPPPPLTKRQQNMEALLFGDESRGIFRPNDEQRTAIGSQAQHLLIEGGPGGGKTDTLARSVMRWIMRDRVNPKNILSVSALKSGVSAMKAGYDKYAPAMGLSKDAIANPRTFHSLAHSILFQRDEQGDLPILEALGMGHVRNILSDVGEKDLLGLSDEAQKDVLQKSRQEAYRRHLSENYGANAPQLDVDQIKTVFEHIGQLKNQGMDPGSAFQKQARLGQKMIDAGYQFSNDPGREARNSLLHLANYQNMLQSNDAIDFEDLMHFGGLAAEQLPTSMMPKHIQRAQGIAVDEAQDVKPGFLRLLKGVMGHISPESRRSIVSMDVGQSALQGLGGIPVNDIHAAYQGFFDAAGGSKEHALLRENRRSTISDVLYNNAVLAQPELANEAKSPMQIPAPGAELGEFPDFQSFLSQKDMNRSIFDKMMERTGLNWGTVKKNLMDWQGSGGDLANITPEKMYEGMNWQAKPSQVPIIFPAHADRKVFEHDLYENIPGGSRFTEDEREAIYRNMYRQNAPGEKEKKEAHDAAQLQFWGMTDSGSRSSGFDYPLKVISRRGLPSKKNEGWSASQWLRNLFIGVSRPKKANAFFGTDRYMNSEQTQKYLAGEKVLNVSQGAHPEWPDKRPTTWLNDPDRSSGVRGMPVIRQKDKVSQDEQYGAELVNIGHPDPMHPDAYYVPKFNVGILKDYINSMVDAGHVAPDSSFFPKPIREHFIPRIQRGESGIVYANQQQASLHRHGTKKEDKPPENPPGTAPVATGNMPDHSEIPVNPDVTGGTSGGTNIETGDLEKELSEFTSSTTGGTGGTGGTSISSSGGTGGTTSSTSSTRSSTIGSPPVGGRNGSGGGNTGGGGGFGGGGGGGNDEGNNTGGRGKNPSGYPDGTFSAPPYMLTPDQRQRFLKAGIPTLGSNIDSVMKSIYTSKNTPQEQANLHMEQGRQLMEAGLKNLRKNPDQYHEKDALQVLRGLVNVREAQYALAPPGVNAQNTQFEPVPTELQHYMGAFRDKEAVGKLIPKKMDQNAYALASTWLNTYGDLSKGDIWSAPAPAVSPPPAPPATPSSPSSPSSPSGPSDPIYDYPQGVNFPAEPPRLNTAGASKKSLFSYATGGVNDPGAAAAHQRAQLEGQFKSPELFPDMSAFDTQELPVAQVKRGRNVDIGDKVTKPMKAVKDIADQDTKQISSVNINANGAKVNVSGQGMQFSGPSWPMPPTMGKSEWVAHETNRAVAETGYYQYDPDKGRYQFQAPNPAGGELPAGSLPANVYLAAQQKKLLGKDMAAQMGNPLAFDDESTTGGYGSGGGLGAKLVQLSHAVTQFGYNVQAIGSSATSYTNAAIDQGSQYRTATLSLNGSGNNGTSGFFDFTRYGPNAINAQQAKMLPEYSLTEIAQGYKALTTGANQQMSPAMQSPLNDVMGMAFLTGMDPTQLTAQMTSISGMSGGNNTLGNLQNLSGMLTSMYGGNLSQLNVSPTLDALQQILPTLQGISPGTKSQAPQAMAIFKTAEDAGIAPGDLGQVASTIGSLGQMGTAPSLSQQYWLNKMFPGQVTADTEYAQFQSQQTGNAQQLAMLHLQQNIGNGMSLPQLTIKVDQAQIQMNQASLDMSGIQLGQAQASVQGSELQYQYGQASYNLNQSIQNQLYGPIGADVSRTGYYQFQRNQNVAGYNGTSPEIATNPVNTQTFGLRNKEFYAGMENQRQDLMLQRSPLLSDALFQQQMKYINEQEDYYKQEIAITNEQRSFEKDWQQKLLDQQGIMVQWQQKVVDEQGKIYQIQQVMTALNQEQLQYQIKVADIQQQYLPREVADLEKIITTNNQQIQGQGPLNGNAITPANLLQSMAQFTKGMSDSQLQQYLRSNVPVDQQQPLFLLIKQIQSQNLNLNQIQQQLGSKSDAALQQQLQKYIQQGATASGQNIATALDKALQAGGTGQTWSDLATSVKNLHDDLSKLAADFSPASPFVNNLGTLANVIGPLSIALGTLGTVLGPFLKLVLPKVGGAASPLATGTETAAETGAGGVIGGVVAPALMAAASAGIGWNMYSPSNNGWQAPLMNMISPGIGAGYGLNQAWNIAQGNQESWQNFAPVSSANWVLQKFGVNTKNNAINKNPFSGNIASEIFGGVGNWWNGLWGGNASSGTPSGSGSNFGGGGSATTSNTFTNGKPNTPQKVTVADSFVKVNTDPSAPLSTHDVVLLNQQQVLGTQAQKMQQQVANQQVVLASQEQSLQKQFGLQGHNDLDLMLQQMFLDYKQRELIIAAIQTNGALISDTNSKIDQLNSDMRTAVGNNIVNAIGAVDNDVKTINTTLITTFPQAKPGSNNTSSSGGPIDGLMKWITNLFGGGGSEKPTTPTGHPGFTSPNVNTEFGANLWYGKHQGVDFAANQGTPLKEFLGGEVLNTGFYSWGGEVDVNIPGTKLVERYLHLSQIGVNPGQKLKQGDPIGLTGGGTPQSGLGYWSHGPHSHVQIDEGDINAGIDPWPIWGMMGATDISKFYGSALPQLAQGGIALSPTNVTIGDGGQPEAVIPLSQLSSMLQTVVSPSAASGGSTSSSAKGIIVQKMIDTLNVTVNGGNGSSGSSGSVLSPQAKDELMAEMIDVLDSVLNQLAGKH